MDGGRRPYVHDPHVHVSAKPDRCTCAKQRLFFFVFSWATGDIQAAHARYDPVCQLCYLLFSLPLGAARCYLRPPLFPLHTCLQQFSKLILVALGPHCFVAHSQIFSSITQTGSPAFGFPRPPSFLRHTQGAAAHDDRHIVYRVPRHALDRTRNTWRPSYRPCGCGGCVRDVSDGTPRTPKGQQPSVGQQAGAAVCGFVLWLFVFGEPYTLAAAPPARHGI